MYFYQKIHEFKQIQSLYIITLGRTTGVKRLLPPGCISQQSRHHWELISHDYFGGIMKRGSCSGGGLQIGLEFKG